MMTIDEATPHPIEEVFSRSEKEMEQLLEDDPEGVTPRISLELLMYILLAGTILIILLWVFLGIFGFFSESEYGHP